MIIMLVQQQVVVEFINSISVAQLVCTPYDIASFKMPDRAYSCMQQRVA